MSQPKYIYNLSENSFSSEQLNQLRSLLKGVVMEASEDFCVQLGAQTHILKDIKEAHPIEKEHIQRLDSS